MREIDLLRLMFESSHQSAQPKEDFSFTDTNRPNKSISERVKKLIGYYLYPLRNGFKSKNVLKILESLDGYKNIDRRPDIFGIGHKGFGQDIFLNQISKRMQSKPSVVICYGCGMGDEVISIARCLAPNHIIGIDYFNYASYWSTLSEKISKRYRTKVDFFQLDYNNPNTTLIGSADLVYSHSVLEHLIDVEKIYPVIKSFLKPGGYFSAQWGPMWNSYSGDHISGELGVHNGFRHLQLTASEYVEYYKNHPRNINTVAAGKLTWLEMGLHNFSRYNEYLQTLRSFFGEVKYLQWVISKDALEFKKLYKQEWESILEQRTDLTELDLVVQCAGILLKQPNKTNVF